ncbi:hypothetical protein DN069_05395 [Streptacidiphilus pinicola]|uniref:Uncharacterized protein n=1 Tax=Streptacidiphilus pinicola TaxID=2219663 RepID=A0A2X0IPK8_9ACTN|nr:hypothetical protein [Streptacidiphilus pinicola]RAG86587.1 hypothetical protein DN069_05395 [Streptacidiphilus pinicola]
MSVVGSLRARGRVYLEQRFPKLPRRLPPLLLASLGLGLLAWGAGPVRSAWLPVCALAASWRVWRAPEESLPRLMFWRSRQRRVFARIAVAMLIAAGVCVVLRTGPAPAVWLAALSPVPLLLDPPLWRAWTWPFRDAVRSARALMLLQEPNRFLTTHPSRVPEWGFDTEQGYCGRPVPVARNSAPYQRKRHHSCRGPARNGEFRSVTWDGRAIAISEGSWVAARIPIEQVAELVTVSEYVRGWLRDEFLVLDRAGRRLATSERAGGPSRRHLAELASAAGLPFADYELGRSKESLAELLFPPA